MNVSDKVEVLMFSTVDPMATLSNCPASTTMLYRVCGNDSNKFEEAMRLVGLFMEEAYKMGFRHGENQ